MDFLLTEEQVMLQEAVRGFALEHVLPFREEWDEKQIFPIELFKKMGEMGFAGVIFPENLNGAGMGYMEYAIVIEELSRVCGSVGITIAAHNSLCSNHIYQEGTTQQKEKYLPRLASGEAIGAWGLTEPGSGSDAAGMLSTAILDGDHYILNGSKNFITHAISADIYVVTAKTDPSQGARGISAFVLEKGMEGFKPGKKENKLGLRASETAELIFENVKVPVENRLGDEGGWFSWGNENP